MLANTKKNNKNAQREILKNIIKKDNNFYNENIKNDLIHNQRINYFRYIKKKENNSLKEEYRLKVNTKMKATLNDMVNANVPDDLISAKKQEVLTFVKISKWLDGPKFSSKIIQYFPLLEKHNLI